MRCRRAGRRLRIMEAHQLAVMGAGNVRCAIPVIVSLATYFGERPLEIRFFDSDEERLDLFDRFARTCFAASRSTHSLISTTDAAEALDGADRVILQVGENCARKYLKERMRQGFAPLDRAGLIEQAVELMLGTLPAGARVLSLMRGDIILPIGTFELDGWPAPMPEAQRPNVPHVALRFIKGEDYLNELFKEAEKSPLKGWLEDPTHARFVSGREE